MNSKILDKAPLPKEPVMGMMGGKIFSKYSRSQSKDSSYQQQSEPKGQRQPSPFVNNSNLTEAPGALEKRILRKANPGQFPDGVLGALSWKTNPQTEKRFYEIILKQPLFDLLQAGMTQEEKKNQIEKSRPKRTFSSRQASDDVQLQLPQPGKSHNISPVAGMGTMHSN